MATNPPKGPGRKGSVKQRSQFLNPKTKLAAKRDAGSGRILEVKTSGGKFKGVRSEK
jgi:hypothetical protein